MPMPASASDWTRFKKLVGAGRAGLEIDVLGNTDVQSPQRFMSSARNGFRPDQDRYGGLGRTRREASKWTDYVAARRADIITVSAHAGSPFGSFGRVLTQTSLCGSNQTCPPSSTLPTKIGPLRSSIYQHYRII